MSNKTLSLVKYAGDYWVTLADFSSTRDIGGYSDQSSVKSAIRTFVVKNSPDKYIAFRGEKQLKNIIQENKNNPLFNADDFKGTRTALIHWTMLESLDERFKSSKEQKNAYKKFYDTATKQMEEEMSAAAPETEGEGDAVELGMPSRSSMLRQLRTELNRIDKEVAVKLNNREKILQAISAIEGLELEEAQ